MARHTVAEIYAWSDDNLTYPSMWRPILRDIDRGAAFPLDVFADVE